MAWLAGTGLAVMQKQQQEATKRLHTRAINAKTAPPPSFTPSLSHPGPAKGLSSSTTSSTAPAAQNNSGRYPPRLHVSGAGGGGGWRQGVAAGSSGDGLHPHQRAPLAT